jgi:hypothetical protein
MSTWQEDIDRALAAFLTVTELADDPVKINEIKVEYFCAPHRPPANLPAGMMAVYAFWWDGVWLKVGKVGPNSQARYTSQHYNAGSAQSTLAGSMINDPQMRTLPGFDFAKPRRLD